MRAEGYEVLEAENGEEALAIAGQYKGGHPVAADRCNHAQTSRAGTGVAPAMRYPAMKVIYMSGHTESALVQDGMLERNTVLLQKPFTVKKILEVIQQLNVSTRT
jgi:two-component system, cell cycle sensor histidine kinase and response regulator CckA